MSLPVNSSLSIPDGELLWAFSRSGGPGGQHANKSNTRVELTWEIVSSEVLSPSQRRRLIDAFGAELRVVADDERSQARNRSLAAERLAERVAEALKPVKSRRATKPTRGSKRRRVEAKRRNSQQKQLRRKPTRDD